MIRGTTPEYILTLDADLTDKTVYVTIRNHRTEVTLTGSDIVVTSEGEGSSSILVRLTQEQTLAMGVGTAEVQVRFIDSEGTAWATDIQMIEVSRVLYEQVINYA